MNIQWNKRLKATKHWSDLLRILKSKEERWADALIEVMCEPHQDDMFSGHVKYEKKNKKPKTRVEKHLDAF